MELIGFTIDTIGKILVAYTALAVHHRFVKEHKVDEKLFMVMKKEQVIGVIGVIMIVVGFMIQMPYKLI